MSPEGHALLMELDFGLDDGFDSNAAFQGAMEDILSDEVLELEEKVRRMTAIVSEGTSDAYRDFLDFRSMAAQMEAACSHDHALSQSLQKDDVLSRFMDGHKKDDGHGHEGHDHDEDDDDEYETDPRTGRKIRRRRSWFGVYC